MPTIEGLRLRIQKESPSVWADYLEKIALEGRQRQVGIEALCQHGFNIETETKKLKQLYIHN